MLYLDIMLVYRVVIYLDLVLQSLFLYVLYLPVYLFISLHLSPT